MASASLFSNNHGHNNKTLFFLFLFGVTLSICFLISSASAEIQCLRHPVKADRSLSFLVVGDWGRRGLYNQSEVALQMGIVGEKLDIDFVISTGDNFYENGLTDVNDPAFYESFSNIYTAPSLHKQWYNVLGNHDYRGDVLAQLSPDLGEKDKRWLCLRSFILHAEFVEFFFVDTTPFVDDYFTHPKDHTYDWRGVLPRKNYLSKLSKDLNSSLRHSTAKWKIVVGHHTIKSAGHHGITQELVSQLLPILEANNVDFYVNGHDHCLEHIIDSKSQIQFLTSGGGSKAWRGDIKWWNPEELKLYYDGQGFMSMEITEEVANFSYYDISGNILHKRSLSKELDSSV
ncbi:Acid phosphatase, type [Parasponia andersonii]|uniref:Purple acid phosphatase n=1 Tax=Parasponia andersonii TaxID=3476 RepID=A0A2P5CIF6_PARAD|nr:Acid phosphatase, type [Parasponia andersonii]